VRGSLLGLVAAICLVLAGPLICCPPGLLVSAHAQLVSSSPGSGQVLSEPPKELRLVFSEPLEAQYSSLDLVNADGVALATGIGEPDPADAHTMLAPAPALEDGTYTVNWRSLSAADGHVAAGFFTFAVGEDVMDHPMTGAAHGATHDEVSLGVTVSEHATRMLGYLGFMLALGLAVIGWVVFRPVTKTWPRKLAGAQLLALGIGGVGSLLLALVASSGPGLDPVGYLTESRPGQSLLWRGAVAAAGLLLAVVLLRRGRPGMSIGIAGVAALGGLVVLASSGHAAAFASPAPTAVMVVHVAACSVWLAGVVALAEVAVLAKRRTVLAALVPRFSALAVVSVGLIGLTGAYSVWLETRLASLDSAYGVDLILKVVLFGVALMLGGLNFIDRGRRLERRGGFDRRIAVEVTLAVAVLAATASLAGGAPPSHEAPVAIAEAPSAVTPAVPVSLGLQPARPGPNRYWVDIPVGAGQGVQVELQLDRLDTDVGSTRIALRPTNDAGTRFLADGSSLPPNSSWDATVILLGPDSAESTRARFNFAMNASGIAAGRATPPIDPLFAIAAILIIAAVLGLAYVLAGGVVPRVEPRAGRLATLGGAVVGAALGIILLISGAPI
jgi:copper transport protein